MPQPLKEPHRFWLAAEARARRLDRDRALLGALGVAAEPLPHQLDTVRRMLTGVGGRWLLADEVGLGKTVQALMLLRGLAAQAARPLKVSVVVPDDLFRQWEAELAARADALALEDADAPVRLHTPGRFQLADTPRMRDADLLIVDEWPRLTVALKEAVRAAARTVPDVLILSATPDLQDLASRRELLSLLEPDLERVAAACDADLLTLVAARDARAAEAVREGRWIGWGEPPPDADRWAVAAAASGAFRRVIRTRRRDYPDLMPSRRYAPILVDATDGDAVRTQSARDALRLARELEVDVRNDHVLQLAGRSPRTLEQGLRNISRKSRELREALADPRRRVLQDQGDARLDGLLDDLLVLRRHALETRVVVVAEDIPTVEHLAGEIERMLEVGVTRMERLPTADDLEVQAAEQRKRLQPFIDGSAPILVAASSAKEGHNLQAAERIYFYALPWSPQDVEQWIGRIDRLGGPALGRGGAGRNVEVTPVVVRGSLEERILSILATAGVFERSALYEGELWDALAGAIEAAAYRADAADWRGLLEQAKVAAARRDAEETLPTAFPMASRAREATAFYDGLDARTYINGSAADGAGWFQARERAAERLLQMLQAFGQLDVWWKVKDAVDPAVRFSTVWYKGALRPSDVLVPEIETDGPGKRRAFLYRRDQLGHPPVGQVCQHAGSRPLKLDFLDHGGRLHDSLIKAYDLWPQPGRLEQHCVEFPAGHAALTFAGCDVLLEIGELKPASAFTFSASELTEGLEPAATQPERDASDWAASRALHAFEQDRRWLLDLVPPTQLRAVAAGRGDSMASVTAATWFEPVVEDAAPRWIKAILASPATSSRLRTLTRRTLAVDASALKGAAVAAVREALPARLFLVAVEMNENVEAARAELARAERRTQPRELAQAGLRAAELALQLAERSRALRLERLRILPTSLAEVELEGVGSLLLRPVRPEG